MNKATYMNPVKFMTSDSNKARGIISSQFVTCFNLFPARQFKYIATVQSVDNLDNLYQSSDLGEPHLSGSLCCDEAQILSKSQTHSNYYLSTIIT